jgi:broad specificity phosphatase PhoE
MKRVILCRHGQDQDNVEKLLNGHRDRPLTELGWEQARAVAQKVAKEYGTDSDTRIDVILSSPLQRAHNTAITIGEAIGVKPQMMAGLIERDFGVLTGKPLADIPKYATQFHDTPHVKYFLDGEGVESFDALYERAKKVLEELDEKFIGLSVLLVAHGDLGKMLLAVRRNISWREALDTPFIGNTDLVELKK